jgi:hypothetical protein
LAASTQASNSSTANDGSTSDAKWQAVSEIIKKRRIDEDSKRRQEEILQREEDLKTREEALAEKEHRFLVEKQEYYRFVRKKLYYPPITVAFAHCIDCSTRLE